MTQLPEEQKSVTPTPEDARPAVDPTQPAATEAGTALADEEIIKRERDLKAETGRKIQKANERAARAEAEARAARQMAANLQGEVGSMRKLLSDQQQNAINERLLKMPTDQRLLAEFQMLREELARKTAAPAAQAPRGDTLEQYVEKKSKQLVGSVNKTFELSEAQALTEEDRKAILEELEEDEGEEEFFEKARKLALHRMKGEAPVADKKSEATKATPAQPVAESVDQAALAQQITEQVLQSLGVSRGNSPRPASGGSVQVTSDDVQKTVRGYDPKVGPKATLERLRALREEAASKVTFPKKK